ncbi:MAG: glycosyltransferase family 39 protein [Lentisphaerota bacterium]
MSDKKIAVLIFIFGLIAYTVGLNGLEFIKIDVRYALFVVDMKKYGIEIFPTLWGQSYTDYLSPGVILMYLASFGGEYINKFALSLPGAIVSSLTLVLIYQIGCSVSRMLGFYGVLMSFFSIAYLSIIRNPSIDLYVIFATTLAFYLVYTADLKKSYKRLYWIPFCLFFGFAFRGMLGIMIPAAVICCYYLVNLNWKKFILFAFVSAISSVICILLLIILIYHFDGVDTVSYFLKDQIFNRMNSNDEFFYYFTSCVGTYALTYPLALIVFVLYLKKIIKPIDIQKEDKTLYLVRSVSVWMLSILLLMSCAGAKNPRYILAIMPPAALLCGIVFVNQSRFKILEYLKIIFFFICRIAPFVCLAAFIGAVITFYLLKIHINFNVLLTIILLLVLCLAVIYVVKRLKDFKLEFALTLVGAIAMILVQIMAIEPIEGAFISARDFVSKIEQLREKNDLKVCFFDLGPDTDDLKYFINIPADKIFTPVYIIPGFDSSGLVAPQKVNLSFKEKILVEILCLFSGSRERALQIEAEHRLYGFEKFTHGLNEFNQKTEDVIYICREKDYESELPSDIKAKSQIILTGKMGRKECVAFMIKEKRL